MFDARRALCKPSASVKKPEKSHPTPTLSSMLGPVQSDDDGLTTGSDDVATTRRNADNASRRRPCRHHVIRRVDSSDDDGDDIGIGLERFARYRK